MEQNTLRPAGPMGSRGKSRCSIVSEKQDGIEEVWCRASGRHAVAQDCVAALRVARCDISVMYSCRMRHRRDQYCIARL